MFRSKFFKAASALTLPSHILRALALLPPLGDYSSLLSLLRTLTSHADQRIRCRSVQLLCRLRPNTSQVERQLESPDSRVRSSAIEAVWGAAAEANDANMNLLFRTAAADSNHRVAVNALVALHRMNDPFGIEHMIQLSKHPDPLFRAAVAWGLGQAKEDPRASAVLETLALDSVETVRRRALKGLSLVQSLA